MANDGELMRPRLVTAMTGQGGTRTIGPESMRRVIVGGDAQAINAAMVEAVEGDLGRRFTTGAKCPGVTTAGKSGTAELGGTGEPHSWFIGFAPAKAPRSPSRCSSSRPVAAPRSRRRSRGDLMTLYLKGAE